MTSTSQSATALVLRDAEGNYFLLTEDQIKTAKASPDQQEALRKVIGDQDVSGYAVGPGGLAALGSLNINVSPQVNINTGVNVAAGNFAPVNQALGQSGVNLLTSSQR